MCTLILSAFFVVSDSSGSSVVEWGNRGREKYAWLPVPKFGKKPSGFCENVEKCIKKKILVWSRKRPNLFLLSEVCHVT